MVLLLWCCSFLDFHDVSTTGSVSVHVNANRQGNDGSNDNWAYFAVSWKDDQWHHIAVTWHKNSGSTSMYFDGRPQSAFWVSEAGVVNIRPPERTVETHMAAGTTRASSGSLVLGQNQECLGGCFSPQSQLDGDMAELRVWDRVLSEEEVRKEKWSKAAASRSGLVLDYDFSPASLAGDREAQVVRNRAGTGTNDLALGADAPLWSAATVPLADEAGKPLPPSHVGEAGHAMSLSDQQVLITTNFEGFPDTEVTVEFWMLSTDGCRSGTPFSYAAGAYDKLDNALLIFSYSDWGISVLEDEGTLADHTSGIASTDGRWHHIAVTWRSDTGQTMLYDNGRLVWEVVRSKGKRIPSGGTLILGREQDCPGGCFDSARGAKGKTQEVADQEYGPQDFYGVIDEVRIWDHVRTQEQINQGMATDMARIAPPNSKQAAVRPVSPSSPGLVALWSFDEGEGYTVHDLTGHGHDLAVLSPPRWVPVETPFAVCGNGIVEGAEQCDDGSRKGGDGCSADCQIEEGWVCRGVNPSVCVRAEDAALQTDSHASWLPHFGPSASPAGGHTGQPSSGGESCNLT